MTDRKFTPNAGLRTDGTQELPLWAPAQVIAEEDLDAKFKELTGSDPQPGDRLDYDPQTDQLSAPRPKLRGRVWTDEEKRRLREMNKGRVYSEEVRERNRQSRLKYYATHKVSDETKAKMAAAKLGTKQSAEHKAKRIAKMVATKLQRKAERVAKGLPERTYVMSEQGKANIRAARLGKPMTPEGKAKLSASLREPKAAAARAESMRQAYARKRALAAQAQLNAERDLLLKQDAYKQRLFSELRRKA